MISKIIRLSVLAIFSILMTPVYAEPIVKPTSAGTINVAFSTDPATPNLGDLTQIKLDFINKQTNALQPHVDYKISVKQGENQVFGIPITHTAEGAVSIPFQFQTAGTYQITVDVEGLVFQPIPPETAVFSINIGNNTTPAVPEFGPLAGMIIIISLIGVITLSKRNQFHF